MVCFGYIENLSHNYSEGKIHYDFKEIEKNFYFNKFSKLRLSNELEKLFHFLKYHYSIEEFKIIIELVARVTKEIAIRNNTISLSKVIALLIHNGYLSYKRNFNVENDVKIIKDITNYLGIDVIRGTGVCRHVSDVHRYVFQELKLFGVSILCLTDAKDTPVPFYANHVINLIKHDGIIYGHDIINESFYNVKSDCTLRAYEQVDDEDEIFNVLYYMPRDEYIIGSSRQKIFYIKDKLHQSSKRPAINLQELNEIIDETNARFDNSIDILRDFRSDANKHIKRIVKSLR